MFGTGLLQTVGEKLQLSFCHRTDRTLQEDTHTDQSVAIKITKKRK